jgi:CRP-like cAMP-binding protein/membrane protease YdiL (CAAX protease family)
MHRAHSGLSLSVDAKSEGVVSFLRQLPFLLSLDDAEVTLLARAVEHLQLPAGALVLREGLPSDAQHFVYRGSVEVLKHAPGESEADALPIHQIDRGSVFGEMSFIDGDPASATIRAANDCELLRVSRSALDAVTADTSIPLVDRLNGAVAQAVIRRLRLISDNHVLALQREIREIHLHHQFERFFMATMVLFGIASLVQKLIQAETSPWQHMAFSWGFLLLSVAPMAWFALRQPRPLADFGVTLRGWQKSLAESLALSLALAALASLVALVVLRKPGQPLLSWGSVATYTPAQMTVFLIGYPLHSLLQEFIGRGVIQTSLSHLMPRKGPMVPVLLTSALFGVYHLYVSISFALLTVVISMVFGWLYARHRTLLGVTLFHTAIGLVSVALGFN